MADSKKCKNPICENPRRTGTRWALYCSSKCKVLVAMRKSRGVPLKQPLEVHKPRKSKGGD